MTYADGLIENCRQHEPAFCTVACPFRLDVRDFMEKLQRGSFNAAYRTYLNAVGFPTIVATLCHEPCKRVCPRRETDGPISMRLLEQAAIDFARNTEPNSYGLPSKQKAVAIVGGGISGLACALRLAEKKYDVTVYEKSERIGGHLHDLLPSDVLLADLARRFMHEEYRLEPSTTVTSLDDLRADAVYVATGAGGACFGLSQDEGGVFASTRPGVFLGGSLTGSDSMGAIADGLRASAALERFIKVGGMNHPVETSSTKLQINVAQVRPAEPIVPANGATFSKEETLGEASRCLRCACDACIRYCDLMHYFKKSPKRIAEEVQITVYPGSLDGNATVATRLIATCNQCGLCKEVCPEHIDTGDLFLRSHRTMRKKGAMPWAYHDFFLRDMAFANGDAWLSRQPPGCQKSRYVLFPGCQVGASDPRYVTESYRLLLETWPDTALMLGCCGAPAEWAGDEAVRDEEHARLRKAWLALGRPTAVFTCPSCKEMFGRYLPDIEGVFLYDLILDLELPSLRVVSGEVASVFDPCASRHEPGVQQTVRKLAMRAGYTLEPLPLEGERAQCCSWGGQVSVAHPPYARFVVKERVTANGNPYLTYCMNCRDIFAAAGKPASHILDAVLGLNGATRLPPTVTQRRLNRLELKRQALEIFWKETSGMGTHGTSLVISPELRQRLSDELILETDIATTISHCEQTGHKVLNPATGLLGGHLLIGKVTYWVQYRATPAGSFEVVNAYAHRMTIDEA
jgi:Fe-S oxidoreductase